MLDLRAGILGEQRGDDPGRLQAQFAGGINGFPGLPNGTQVDWQITGMVAGNQLMSNGRVMVTSTGRCNGAALTNTLTGARS